jgi:hypothetical protein
MSRTTLCTALIAIVLVRLVSVTATGATITVTNAGDTGPGTLRAALAGAGNNDVINFALAYPATITLTMGELLVSNNIKITGPGATSLIISGNNASRVFHIGTSNTVTISGLTISDGVVSAGGVGAGIYLDNATLTLMNCAIRANHASGGSTANGAGIYVNQSQLTAIGCMLDSNGATGNGGGIYNVGSTLTLNNSTISSNNGVNGGGIYNASGTVTVINSLIYANAATHGGGIANVGTLGLATLTVNNCTLSGNTVFGSSATGSQIQNARQFSNASATIGNSTILSNNVAPAYSGGAMYNDNGASLTIGNTIIQASAQEHTIINAGPGMVVSAGYNLSFDNGGNFLTATGDQINTDPLLDLGTGPRDNGGPTFTIALQANSPAIDKGKRDIIPALSVPTDQRGEPRPFNDPNIANASGGDGSDIGAYEADLRLTKLVRMSNDLQFTFTSIVGKNYQLEVRSSLISGNWNSFGSVVSGNGGIAQSTAPGAFIAAVQFYRVVQSAPAQSTGLQDHRTTDHKTSGTDLFLNRR